MIYKVNGMNKYRISSDAYDRKNDKLITKEEIKERLIGQEYKEIIDVTANEYREIETVG